jgi:hypothetical protein
VIAIPTGQMRNDVKTPTSLARLSLNLSTITNPKPPNRIVKIDVIRPNNPFPPMRVLRVVASPRIAPP